MRISNKANKVPLQDIELNGTKIEEVCKFTNLGLTLNNKLNWSDHIENIVNRASSRLNMLSKVRFVIPRLALIQLYISMIRPILEYASIIYNNCTLSMGQSIERIQRRAAILCTGAYRHTEYQTLLRELG